MRRSLFALISVTVMALQLWLPVIMACGVDPCANAGDHACPPTGDDCHDCARCSPQPAVVPALPGVVLDVVPTSTARPTFALSGRPPDAPSEPPSRVPRSLA
jgi:hypothetical protein